MQPYLFPYFGYFKLVSSVDIFVFLDDVNFIKKGWINRNRIWDPYHSEIRFFTFPLESMSQNRLINETKLFEYEKNQMNFLKTLTNFYQHSPYFRDVSPLLKTVFGGSYESVSELGAESVMQTSKYLHLDSQFLFSSQLKYEKGKNRTERLINICKHVGANVYVNLRGGTSLYDSNDFFERGIELQFTTDSTPDSSQSITELDTELSIIHPLMNVNASILAKSLER